MNSIVYLILGIFFVGLGGFTLWTNISKKRRCSVEAEAEVTEVKRIKHGTGRRRSIDYSPVLTYKAEGQERSGLAQISSAFPGKFKVGQIMTIKYDPNDPDTFCVKGKVENIKWSIMGIILGGLFIFFYLWN